MTEHAHAMSMSERADELEEEKMHEMERILSRSTFSYLADGKQEMDVGADLLKKNPGKHFLMGADPRLPPMPEKPTLVDYFRHRFASTAHLLQSAAHALKTGQPEKVVMACLVHDIAIVSFIRCDHGYWGAQMIEPYVDEEVAWAVKTHQALRFFRMIRSATAIPTFTRPCSGPATSRKTTSSTSTSAPARTNGT